MKLVIIIGLVIIIIALAAVVVVMLLRNKKQQPNESVFHDNNNSPFANNNTALNNRISQTDGFNRQQSVVPQRNSLQIAQDFIDQQRYDEAEVELKTATRMQPGNNSLQLKLLNLYAITNKSQEFDNVFSQIIASGDINTIKQAEQLKSMIDAEKLAVQNAAKKPYVKTEFVAEKGIDFDLSNDTTDYNQSPSNSLNSIEDLDTNHITETNSLDNISLDFGEADEFITEGNISTSDTDLDFELSMDSETDSDFIDMGSSLSDVPQQNTTLSQDNTFDLEFDDIAKPNQSASVSADPTNQQNVSSTNLDPFDFENLNTDNEESKNIASTTDSHDSFDFDFEDLNADNEESKSITPSIQNNIDLESSNNNSSDSGFDFNFDEPVDTSTSAEIQDFDKVSSNISQTQSNLDIEVTSNDSLEPDSGFDFNFDEPADVSVNNATTSHDDNIGFDLTETEGFSIEDDSNFSTLAGAAVLGGSAIAASSFMTETDNSNHTTTTTESDFSDLNLNGTDDFDLNIGSESVADNSSDFSVGKISNTVEDTFVSGDINNFEIDSISDESDVTKQAESMDFDSSFDFDIADDEPSSKIDESFNNDVLDDFAQSNSFSLEDRAVESVSSDNHNKISAPPTFTDNSPVVNELNTDSSESFDSIGLVDNSDLEPTVTNTSNYTDNFAVLESLDNNQITLDLASQYLDLGEYDGAKKLLTEIISRGDPSQKQKAQELLSQAS